MGTGEPELLALRAAYGSLYNEMVRPEFKFTISHYLRTQWGPLLGAARLWFVVALRQRCFWNERQEWCIADKQTLAAESGLSPRTVNRIVAAESDPQGAEERDVWTAWFFSKKRRRRYDRQIGRTVNAPNRYHVLLDDPLTPQHQAGLAHYLRQHAAGGDPRAALQALEALIALPEEARTDVLESAPPTAGPPIPAGFVLDVVEANCPAADSEQLKVDIARAALRLHQAITCPERVYIGTQYYRRQWLPRLGPVSALLVVNLRARCYWNERTGELRDTCRASWIELAAEVGCTARQLRNLRQDEALQRFVTVEAEGHGAARSTFHVQVPDLLVDEDEARFESRLVQWAQDQPGFEIDPESGQLDARPLLLQAQAAPGTGGQAEILAPGRMEKGRPERDSTARGRSLESQAAILASGGPAEAGDPDTGDTGRLLERVSQEEVLTPGGKESPGGSGAEGAVIHSLPSQAEVLAPGPAGQAEILASGGRKFWRIEGLQAEILAPASGNFGTTGKLLLITLDLKGPVTAALALSPTLCADPEQLAAAARQLLLAGLGIEEPNRSRLAARRSPCDQILAWGLYAMTQRGLQNRAGYIYRRLLAGDPAPPEFVDLARLPPPVWHALVSAVRRRQEHLLPVSLHAAYRRWWAALQPVWNEIACRIECGMPIDLDAFDDGDEFGKEGEGEASPRWHPEEGEHKASPLQGLDEGEGEASPRWHPEEGEHEASPLQGLDEGEGEASPRWHPEEGEHKASPLQGLDEGEGEASPRWHPEEGEHEASPLQGLDEGEGEASPRWHPEEGEGEASPLQGLDEGEPPPLPGSLRALVHSGVTAVWQDPGWLLVTSSLIHARRLSQQAAREAPDLEVRIGVRDGAGQVHLVQAELLALAGEPLSDLRWSQLQNALQLRMGQKAFERWWPEVQPLGLAGGLGHDPPTVVFCVPDQELRAYLAARHTDVAAWACMSILHHEVRVSFITYDEPLPEPAAALI